MGSLHDPCLITLECGKAERGDDDGQEDGGGHRCRRWDRQSIAHRFVSSGYRVITGDADAKGLKELSDTLNGGTRSV